MSVPARQVRQKAPNYDFASLAREYPSLRTLAGPTAKAAERSWVAAFTTHPEALETMLSDLIKQAYAKPGRIGQRPMPREEEVNLNALLHGEYTDDPITVVLTKRVKQGYHKMFAAKIFMSRRMYQRMFLPDNHADKYHPTMNDLERIAEALSKPPSYFLEYRLMAAQAAFARLITERPVIATRLYRDFLQVSKESPFLRS